MATLAMTGLVLGGTVATAAPASAHTTWCGRGTHLSLKHPSYRLQFVREFPDDAGHSIHEVLKIQQLFGTKWETLYVDCGT